MPTGKSQSKSKSWQKTPITNLVRYKPSGFLFARIRINGKLIRRTLNTKTLTVAKLRLSDLERTERGNSDLNAAYTEGKMTFGEAMAMFGERVAKVRDKGLYRDKHGTFEEYCQTELGFSRPYAYNLIGSAEVSEQLSAINEIEIKPVNEAQCRELISVPETKRVEAWKNAIKAAGEKPLTAKVIHQAVAKFKPKPAKKAKVAKKTQRLNVKPGLKLIEAMEKLADSDNTDALMKKLAELRTWLEKAGE